MKKVLLEVLIENQGIERDFKLLKLIEEVSLKFINKLEVRIFKYAGPHEYPFSIGILDAYKLHAIPAISINGRLAFVSKVPSKEELEEAIKNSLKNKTFKVSRK